MNSLPYSRLPGMNNLFLDFMEHFDQVSDFYPQRDTIPTYEINHRDVLCEILQHQNQTYGNAASEHLLNKLKQPGTRCLITGQQVGLLCSPLYTLWKALTAIRLSKKYDENGTPCVPVFWMATEDHNLNEITSFALLKQDTDLLKFSLKEHLFLKRQPAGTVPADNEEIRKILIRSFQEVKVPQIRAAYSGTTLSTGFAKTLVWLLKDFPIILVDPSDPSLKKIAAPFFEKVIQKVHHLLELLERQNATLKERKYPVQVQMEPDRLPLFKIIKEERIPVRKDETENLPAEQISPSALLRPLFQDYLFPTLGYVAGPGEIAYFAQLHSWYQALDLIQPQLFARASVTLIPPATRSFLENNRLNPEELYLQEDTLVDALLNHEGTKQMRKELKDLQSLLKTTLPKLQAESQSIDRTLDKGLLTAFRKMDYQLSKMERKTFLAAKRKNVLLAEQIRKAKNVVYPDDKLQERYLSIFSFAGRLPELILQIYEQIQWDEKAHQWIYI